MPETKIWFYLKNFGVENRVKNRCYQTQLAKKIDRFGTGNRIGRLEKYAILLGLFLEKYA